MSLGKKPFGSIAQLVRAPALQAGGHWFESSCSHHLPRHGFGPVVQLVRTPACHAGGRRFEPVLSRHRVRRCALYASVAQLVEQRTENPRVVGSIPTGGTNFVWRSHTKMCSERVLRRAAHQVRRVCTSQCVTQSGTHRRAKSPDLGDAICGDAAYLRA